MNGGDPKMITTIDQSTGGAHLASAIFTGALKKTGVELHDFILLSAHL